MSLSILKPQFKYLLWHEVFSCISYSSVAMISPKVFAKAENQKALTFTSFYHIYSLLSLNTPINLNSYCVYYYLSKSKTMMMMMMFWCPALCSNFDFHSNESKFKYMEYSNHKICPRQRREKLDDKLKFSTRFRFLIKIK